LVPRQSISESKLFGYHVCGDEVFDGNWKGLIAPDFHLRRDLITVFAPLLGFDSTPSAIVQQPFNCCQTVIPHLDLIRLFNRLLLHPSPKLRAER
jgi:hypothetical protein